MDLHNILLFFTGALAFYGVGLIWSMELVTLRSWIVLEDKKSFHKVRYVLWKTRNELGKKRGGE